MKVTSNSEKPSALCYAAASTTTIENSLCSCGAAKDDHVKDYFDPTSAGLHGLVEAATRSMARHVRAKMAIPQQEREESQRQEGAFPSASAERAKKRKADGIEVKKKKSKVDDHYDDCGTSLKGLGANAETYLSMDFHADADSEDYRKAINCGV